MWLFIGQMRMDEHSRENASLTRQLEAALCDARRMSETARDKVSSRVSGHLSMLNQTLLTHL